MLNCYSILGSTKYYLTYKFSKGNTDIAIVVTY